MNTSVYCNKISPKYFINKIDTDDIYVHNITMSSNNDIDIPINVIFVIDISGSMVQTIKDVLNMVLYICDNITNKIRTCIVTFSTTAKVEMGLGNHDINEIKEIIENIHVRDSTNLSEGLITAFNQLKDHDNDNNNIFVLTDGCATDGITDVNEMKEFINNQKNVTTLNSVGFGYSYDSKMLDKITNEDGFYVHLNRNLDLYNVGADITNMIKNLTMCKYKLSVKNGYIYETDDNKLEEKKYIITQKNKKKNLLVLSKTEEIVVTLENENNEKHIITSKYIEQDRTKTMKMQVNLIRMMVCEYLSRMLYPNVNKDYLLDVLDPIRQLIDETLTLSNDDTKKEERILDTLYSDISSFVNKIYNNEMNNESNNMLYQILKEHLTKNTISSMSQMRTTYASNNQRALRLKFLRKSEDDEEFNKSRINAKDDEDIGDNKDNENNVINEECIKRRERADKEFICYVTLSSWRDDYIGIGIVVYPKTKREIIKRLQPDMEVDNFYLSNNAFNDGVRNKIEKNIIDDDIDKNGIMRATVYSKMINNWLPLYINKYHWAKAKYLMESAVSLIATGFNDMFKTSFAFDVCTNLLTRIIVKAITKKQIDNNIIRMYCNVHRLFLVIATEEYTELKNEAETKLKSFISKYGSTDRKMYPNLGDLINCLLITDEYKWDDIKELYITEAYRRCTARLDQRFDVLKYNTNDELINAWNDTNKSSEVTLFTVMFINTLMTGKTINDVKSWYDKGWGYVDDVFVEKIRDNFNKIMSTNNLSDKLKLLDINVDKETLTNIILWANINGYNNDMCKWKYNKKLNNDWQKAISSYQKHNNNENNTNNEHNINNEYNINNENNENKLIKTKREKYNYFPEIKHDPTKSLFFYINRTIECDINVLNEIENDLIKYMTENCKSLNEQDIPSSYKLMKNKKNKSKHHGYLIFEKSKTLINFYNKSTMYGNHYVLHKKEKSEISINIQICKKELINDFVPARVTNKRDYIKSNETNTKYGIKQDLINSHRKHLTRINFSSCSNISEFVRKNVNYYKISNKETIKQIENAFDKKSLTYDFLEKHISNFELLRKFTENSGIMYEYKCLNAYEFIDYVNVNKNHKFVIIISVGDFVLLEWNRKNCISTSSIIESGSMIFYTNKLQDNFKYKFTQLVMNEDLYNCKYFVLTGYECKINKNNSDNKNDDIDVKNDNINDEYDEIIYTKENQCDDNHEQLL